VIGDIGPKVLGGTPANDNGFVRFDRIRIPKWQMLSKFAQVTDDGKYVRPPHAKLSYGGVSACKNFCQPTPLIISLDVVHPYIHGRKQWMGHC
jgi:hypothetical protein